MTNAQPDSTPASDSRQVYLPAAGVLLFIAAPILLVIGGFFVGVNIGSETDAAVSMTMIGTVMFWTGVAALVGALVIDGVRSIAQQQLNLQR